MLQMVDHAHRQHCTANVPSRKRSIPPKSNHASSQSCRCLDCIWSGVQTTRRQSCMVLPEAGLGQPSIACFLGCSAEAEYHRNDYTDNTPANCVTGVTCCSQMHIPLHHSFSESSRVGGPCSGQEQTQLQHSLDVVGNVLLAQLADQLDVGPGQALLLLASHHCASIAPPFGRRPAWLGSALGPQVGVGGP